MHRTVVAIAWGWGPGRGTPFPGEKNHTVPPQGSRAGAGVLGTRAREGRNRRGTLDCPFRRLIHRSPTPPAPSALLPRPEGGGQWSRYPRKGHKHGGGRPLRGDPDLALPHHHPMHLTVVAIARGWGPGRKTPPALSRCPRAGERGLSWRDSMKDAAGKEELQGDFLECKNRRYSMESGR